MALRFEHLQLPVQVPAQCRSDRLSLSGRCFSLGASQLLRRLHVRHLPPSSCSKLKVLQAQRRKRRSSNRARHPVPMLHRAAPRLSFGLATVRLRFAAGVLLNFSSRRLDGTRVQSERRGQHARRRAAASGSDAHAAQQSRHAGRHRVSQHRQPEQNRAGHLSNARGCLGVLAHSS